MHKAIFVGCGGSGAETLAFLMDQLKSMLRDAAPNLYPDGKVKLPDAWGFVSVDVPLNAEDINSVSNVAQAGGTYIPCGANTSYAVVDNAVCGSLAQNNGSLHGIASWLVNRPEDITVNVSLGAGQYRRLGRMLFLKNAARVRTALAGAFNKVNDAQDLGPLVAHLPDVDSYDDTIQAYVVTSMAGGAGSSMAIDVCETLSEFVTPENIIVLAVTPDIFSNGGEAAFAGVNPNSLAMFAELQAAQYGAAAPVDRELYEQLGAPIKPKTRVFKRMFPVGRKIGLSGVQLGIEGQPYKKSMVYRAVARGLAGMTMDDTFNKDFWAYRVTNPQTPQPQVSDFGWGELPDNGSWGSFGYAQLSTGRERFAEYAAQRLAKRTVEQVRKGHERDEGDGATAEVQLARAWERRMSDTNRLGNMILPLDGLQDNSVPLTRNPFGQWSFSQPEFSSLLTEWVNHRSAKIREQLALITDVKSQDWAQRVSSILANASSSFGEESEIFQIAMGHWTSESFAQQRTLDLVADLTQRESGRLAIYALQQFTNRVRVAVVPNLKFVAGNPPAGLVIPPAVSTKLPDKGRIDNPQGLVDEIMRGVEEDLRRVALCRFARELVPVVEDYIKDFLGPLEQSMMRSMDELSTACAVTEDPSLGVADMQTNVPAEWPASDNIQTPKRFGQAPNEVYLTSVDNFPKRFEENVKNAINDKYIDFEDCYKEVAGQVLAGEWATPEGTSAPKDLLVLKRAWVPEAARVLPGSNATREPARAGVSFRIAPEEILDRSRAFIDREGYNFHKFIHESLSDYVKNLDEQGQADVVAKFQTAMNFALPLAQVSNLMVNMIYGRSVQYTFSYSTIPFGTNPELVAKLNSVITNDDNIKPPQQGAPLDGVVVANGSQRKIDISGSYENFSPLAFQSVMEPISQQRQTKAGTGADFWQDRRARPIPAALPMGVSERKAMVAGWYVGLLTGRIDVPRDTNPESDLKPIRIYDKENKAAETFPCPLLSSVYQMRSGKLDWLPAVLESYSLAVADAGAKQTLDPLRPYVLLRQFYDSGAAVAEAHMTLNAEKIFREWLKESNGAGKIRREGYAAGTGPDVTPEERLAAAKKWLNTHKSTYQNKLRREHTNLMGERTGVNVRAREVALKQLPLMADLADDAIEMIDKLLNLLDKAYKNQPETGVDSSSGASGNFLDNEGDL